MDSEKTDRGPRPLDQESVVRMSGHAWRAVVHTLEAHAAGGGYPASYVISLASAIREDARLPLG